MVSERAAVTLWLDTNDVELLRQTAAPRLFRPAGAWPVPRARCVVAGFWWAQAA